jgi:hypothetical protein
LAADIAQTGDQPGLVVDGLQETVLAPDPTALHGRSTSCHRFQKMKSTVDRRGLRVEIEAGLVLQSHFSSLPSVAN